MQPINERIGKQLLALTLQFSAELGGAQARMHLTLDVAIEKDLGLDSLKKAELIHRIENHFSIQLPNALLAEANTLHDFIQPIQQANPSQTPTAGEFIAELAAAHFDPSDADNLVDVLLGYAQQEADRPHIYLQDDEGKETTLSYGKLLTMASRVANGLHELGVQPADTVAIMLPTCEEFFSTFFGVLLAGAVPVPIYPPFRSNQIEAYAKREVLILRNAGIRVLVTFGKAKTLSKLLKSFIPSLIAVKTADQLVSNNEQLILQKTTAAHHALIQYTSGSTGNPKGVLLNHGNLLANIRCTGQALKITREDVIVSWLPLYHDMGLIGTWLLSFYYGLPLTIMSPLTFLTRPERWLWAIHYHRATISAAPNFAYGLCAHKISDTAIEGLDLSSWRIALNGAEAIYPKTIRQFSQRFGKYGFKPGTFFPAYGLAESSVSLVFPPPGREPVFDLIQRDAFDSQQLAIPADAHTKHTHEFVACGTAIPEHKIRIVDEQQQVLPERTVGALQFQGPSTMQGYYNNPEATAAARSGEWIDTGDYAYLADGDLYIAGRKKDMIIKAGHNYYPDEIEEITSHVDGIRKGCVVAFGANDPNQGTEQLIIVAEVLPHLKQNHQALRQTIISNVASHLGVPPDVVVLVPPKTVPKTSSGKLRRSQCKDDYLKGKLHKNTIPAWLQMGRLVASSAGKRIKARGSKLLRLLYSGYIIILFTPSMLLLWLSVLLLPPGAAKKAAKAGARFMLFLSGCPVQVKGRDNLKTTSPVVIVVNHASYLDSLVLTAILPTNIAFVGKKELMQVPILGSMLRKLGHITIDRLDANKSVATTQDISNTLTTGKSIVIFPEGTFTDAPGLRPFKSGAFKIAVDTQTPILPIALKGTRQIFRSDSLLLKLGKIIVTINNPIMPQAQGWQEITRLSELTRANIAKHCGEMIININPADQQTTQ